jgi:hypothetical protein
LEDGLSLFLSVKIAILPASWNYVSRSGGRIFALECVAALDAETWRLTWLIAVKLLILIFYLPALVRWLARNRPRPLVPSALASELLPATKSPAKI